MHFNRFIQLFANMVSYVKTIYTVSYYYTFIVTNDGSETEIELKLRVAFLYNW